MAKEAEKAQFNAKAMVEKHVANGTKGQYFDRKKVEIIKETNHYQVGRVIEPHKLKAEALIEQGIAKAYKEKE